MQIEGFPVHHLRDRTSISCHVNISYARRRNVPYITATCEECCPSVSTRGGWNAPFSPLCSDPGSNLFGAVAVLRFDVHVRQRGSIAHHDCASEQTLIIVTDQRGRRPKGCDGCQRDDGDSSSLGTRNGVQTQGSEQSANENTKHNRARDGNRDI